MPERFLLRLCNSLANKPTWIRWIIYDKSLIHQIITLAALLDTLNNHSMRKYQLLINIFFFFFYPRLNYQSSLQCVRLSFPSWCIHRCSSIVTATLHLCCEQIKITSYHSSFRPCTNVTRCLFQDVSD